ncbi:Lrp/AsnC family transcriptional regulator [Kiloniella sp.]|uniref:Lrp/AsnC family transcriptional regulator n=1 Tax=Kiloniella sp. TaxID=1938587 RepID=UPI003A8DF07A
MDNVDKRILEELQLDARTPIALLSEKANASTASVQRRLKRLRESGVIQSENAIVDPEAVGYEVTAVISVDLERDRIDETDAFKRRAKKEPQVQHCYCVAGGSDFVLIVIAKNMKDYEAFTHRFFFNDSNVRRFQTSIAVSRVKATTFVPMLKDDEIDRS